MKQEDLISLAYVKKNIATAFRLLGISKAHGWEDLDSSVVHGVQDHRELLVIINRPKRRIIFRIGLKEFTVDARRDGDSIAKDFRSRVAGYWVRYEDKRFQAVCERERQAQRLNSAAAELESRIKKHMHTISNREFERDIHAEVQQFEGGGATHPLSVHVYKSYRDGSILADVKISALSQAQAESLLHFLQNGGI